MVMSVMMVVDVVVMGMIVGMSTLMIVRTGIMAVTVTLERHVCRRSGARTAKEPIELRRQQIKTDESDQRIAHAFELVRPGIDLKPRSVKPNSSTLTSATAVNAWRAAAMKEMITPRLTVSSLATT